MTHKVLIVEDDVAIGDILKLKLQQEGYDVHWCRDGFSGLETLKQVQPDIVVTDISLPIMSGIELLVEKNNIPSLAHIPVIILSNSFVIKDAERMNDLNVAAFLIKSNLTPAEILSIIEDIMQSSQQHSDSLTQGDSSVPTEADTSSVGQIDLDVAAPQSQSGSDMQSGVQFNTQSGNQAEHQADIHPESGIAPHVISSGIPKPVDMGSVSLQGRNILLVEDDTFLHSILGKRFESERIHVIHATTGEDALKEIANDSNADIQMVVLDILLPGMSGFDVLQSIRKNPRTENMLVVMISNFSQQEELIKAHSMGAHYLVKALVSPDDIVLKIKEVMAGALV
jgi:two-component system, chemotaxis family, chemotaxis protein CheY